MAYAASILEDSGCSSIGGYPLPTCWSMRSKWSSGDPLILDKSSDRGSSERWSCLQRLPPDSVSSQRWLGRLTLRRFLSRGAIMNEFFFLTRWIPPAAYRRRCGCQIIATRGTLHLNFVVLVASEDEPPCLALTRGLPRCLDQSTGLTCAKLDERQCSDKDQSSACMDLPDLAGSGLGCARACVQWSAPGTFKLCYDDDQALLPALVKKP